jgi:hypothetical protein
MIGLALATALILAGDAEGTSTLPDAAPAPQISSSGETIFTGQQIREMGGQPPKLLDSPPEPDVDELYRQGIQGEMQFTGSVGTDGRMHDVVLTKSSRSAELDAIGLSLVNGSTFTPATDGSGTPIAARVVYPINLWKDSLLNPEFAQKSCAQFIIDADWFAQAFPEERPERYRGWLLANGALLSSSLEREAPLADFASVYEECKEHPRRRFLEVLARG